MSSHLSVITSRLLQMCHCLQIKYSVNLACICPEMYTRFFSKWCLSLRDLWCVLWKISSIQNSAWEESCCADESIFFIFQFEKGGQHMKDSTEYLNVSCFATSKAMHKGDLPSNTWYILWLDMHWHDNAAYLEKAFALTVKFEFVLNLEASGSPAWISVWRSCRVKVKRSSSKFVFKIHASRVTSTPSFLHYSSSHNSRVMSNNSRYVNNCSVCVCVASDHQGWEGFSTGGMAAVCGKTGETGHVRHVSTPQRGARSHLVTVSSLCSLLNHTLLLHSFSECTHCEPVSVSHLFVSHTSFSSWNCYAVWLLLAVYYWAVLGVFFSFLFFFLFCIQMPLGLNATVMESLTRKMTALVVFSYIKTHLCMFLINDLLQSRGLFLTCIIGKARYSMVSLYLLKRSM